jgi:hypothetical protein
VAGCGKGLRAMADFVIIGVEHLVPSARKLGKYACL